MRGPFRVSPPSLLFPPADPCSPVSVNDRPETEAVFEALRAGAIENGNFSAYRTDGADADKPKDYWHYSNNVRIAPVLAVAKLGWTLARTGGPVSTVQGNHGFDNAEDDMNGIFIASGPNVTAGGAILTRALPCSRPLVLQWAP